MKRILLILCCLAAYSLEAKTRHRKTGHKKPAPAATGKVASRSKKGHSKQPVKTAQRTRQLSPSPERYREIQEALAAKGYLKSTPSGVWDQDSAAALRQFQEEQNLEPTGRVNSLSLIALGLGPRTEASSRPPVQP